MNKTDREVFGWQVILEDKREEIIKGLIILMRQTSGKTEWQYPEGMLNAVAVYRIDADKISSKAK